MLSPGYVQTASMQDEQRRNGARPVILEESQGKEDFDIAHFDEEHLDFSVSCLSAKYHGASFATTHMANEIEWRLPGHGESKADCGDYLKAVGCPGHDTPTVSGDKHTRKVVLKHCFNPACPICYVPWAVREGTAAADRMKAAERLYRAAGIELGEPRHFTFSPPQAKAIEDMKTIEGFKQLKADFVKLIKESGIVGGAFEFHSHRVNKAKELYLSPHFHVAGYGYITGTKAFYKASEGWVYKNMGARKTLSGTIIYALDHCGLAYVGGKRVFHALTWFGLLSYNKLAKAAVINEEKEVPCKACSEALHEYALVVNEGGHGMSPDWNKDLGVYHVKVKTIIYKLTKRVNKKLKIEYEQTRFERAT